MKVFAVALAIFATVRAEPDEDWTATEISAASTDAECSKVATGMANPENKFLSCAMLDTRPVVSTDDCDAALYDAAAAALTSFNTSGGGCAGNCELIGAYQKALTNALHAEACKGANQGGVTCTEYASRKANQNTKYKASSCIATKVTGLDQSAAVDSSFALAAAGVVAAATALVF